MAGGLDHIRLAHRSDSLHPVCTADNGPSINSKVRLRLSAAQIDILRPGVDVLVRLFAARKIKNGVRFEYPFRIYPPPGGFDKGIFSQDMMNKVIALAKTLKPDNKSGVRVMMDTFELRAASYAIRARLDSTRQRRYRLRREKPEDKAKHSYEQLKTRSQRVIQTLERHMKRANRALQLDVTSHERAALMAAWTAHLRWMRLHIAYFKPWPKIIQGRKIRQQQEIDELMLMAVNGIRDEGYDPPEWKELRRVIRLYVRSARRDREGVWSVRYLLENKETYSFKWHLAQWVLGRLDLPQLEES